MRSVQHPSSHRRSSARGWAGLGALWMAASATGAADLGDPAKLPPPAAIAVDFDRDIHPIFEHSCLRCHGPERPKSRFRLDNRDAALKGGENGVDILPGKSAESPLIHYVARLVPDMEMPPEGKADPLTAEQVGLLRAWIDQGVAFSKTNAGPQLAYSVSPGLRFISVSGNERKFREHYWMREGWAGGLDQFHLEDRPSADTKVTVDGRFTLDQQDYKLKLQLDKTDLGFFRFGFEQFRKYYDDLGPGYAPYLDTPLSLNRDLYTDQGRAFFDAGLTLPNWPKIVLGYEYQYKEGLKSSLQYDFYSPDAVADPQGAAVFPAARHVDEKTHIVKLDVTHDVQGVTIEDNFRGEFYDLTTTRRSEGWFQPGFGIQERNEYDHFQAANALRAEKQLRDWLLVSAGYLYSHLDGSGGFSQESFIPSDPTTPPFLTEYSDTILLSQDAHIFNANAQLGPWDGLTFVAGLQNEWMQQDGMASTLGFASSPTSLYAKLGRRAFDESFGLRYTAIPLTVLHADVRFQQEGIDHYESELVPDGIGGDRSFVRDTDATGDLRDYRAGFTISPWTAASFSASYRRKERVNDYDHLTDIDESSLSGNGYPAFILHRDTTTDAVELKTVLRPVRWLNSTLKYQLVTTEYNTVTRPGDLNDGNGAQGGGSVRAANYRAHIASLNNTLSPWSRFYLSSTFSYTRSRIVSGVNNDTSVVPYEGDIYSLLNSATFVIDPKTDLTASYFLSIADYGQSNSETGLPLGIAYSRHGLLAGVTRRWKKPITTRLQYGFFTYSEPASNHRADYTAHAVFATINIVVN